MSDLPIDYQHRLDLAEQVRRIEHETRRIEHETVEIQKLNAETRKLLSESRKFNRDPWFVLIGAIIAAIAARLPEILHAFGVAS